MAIVLFTPGRLAAGSTRESSYKMAFGASFAGCAKERILAKKKRYGVRLWLRVLHLVRTHTHALSAPGTRPLVWHGLQSNRRVTCALRERTTTTKPAGESCRARGRRSRLQMMPKWCPGPAPCRLAGGTAPMVTLGADGAVGRERRERQSTSRYANDRTTHTTSRVWGQVRFSIPYSCMERISDRRRAGEEKGGIRLHL